MIRILKDGSYILIKCDKCNDEKRFDTQKVCLRCGHRWGNTFASRETLVCPGCGTYLWNTPRRLSPIQPDLKEKGLECSLCHRTEFSLLKSKKNGNYYCHVCIAVGSLGRNPGPAVDYWIKSKDSLALQQQTKPSQEEIGVENDWTEPRIAKRLSSGRCIQPKQTGMDGVGCAACLDQDIYLHRKNAGYNGAEVLLCEFCCEALEKGISMSQDCREWLVAHKVGNKSTFQKNLMSGKATEEWLSGVRDVVDDMDDDDDTPMQDR